MANRYWVGGTGNWDNASTAHWSATSGGAGSASIPTSADDVFFDANSGGGICTLITATAVCKSLTCTGFNGTITGTTVAIDVYGNFTLAVGMAWTVLLKLEDLPNMSFKDLLGEDSRELDALVDGSADF